MSNNTLLFYFKTVYTTNVWELDVNSDISTADFVDWINSSECHILFNIHKEYYIQVIESGINIYGDSELGDPIMVSYSDTFGQRFNPKFTSFYLRPVDPNTQEFIRRNDYSVAP